MRVVVVGCGCMGEAGSASRATRCSTTIVSRGADAALPGEAC